MRTIPAVALLLAPLLATGCASSGGGEGGTTPPLSPPPEASSPEPEKKATPEEELIECEGPPVELGFGWPSTLSAKVRSLELFEIEDSRREKPARQGIPTEHRMVVEPGEQERLRVRFEALDRGRPRLDGVLLQYGEERPTFVISGENGELLGVDGVDALRAAHEDVKLEQGLDERESEEILSRITEEALLEDAKAWWHMMLSGWVGRTLACDEPQTSEMEIPIKTLGGLEVPMKLEWRYLGSQPCAEESGRGGQTCAELVVAGRADPKLIQARLQERIRASGEPGAGQVVVHEAELVRLARLRVEPHTMILHGVRLEEHIGSAFQIPGSETAGRRQSDAHTLAFQYGTGTVQSQDEPGEASGRESGEAR